MGDNSITASINALFELYASQQQELEKFSLRLDAQDKVLDEIIRTCKDQIKFNDLNVRWMRWRQSFELSRTDLLKIIHNAIQSPKP